MAIARAFPAKCPIKAKKSRSLCCVLAASAKETLSDQVPLLAAVLDRARRLHEKPFHVPGHKRGRVVSEDMRRLVQGPGGPLAGDLTEIHGLDYLSSPTGVIADAQALAAAAFGADRSFFLVNGCTAGIHAAVMATCPSGSTLLLARNCHLSAFNAAVLAGCRVAWVEPVADGRHGVAHCVRPEALREALRQEASRGGRVGAVMVVSPTYFGVAARVDELAAICHEAGVPLLVDEAHGAHFSPASQQLPGHFPPAALQSGADAAIHSTHKVLTAMTQAAMLHVKRGRIDENRVARSLQVLQSSSPSYLLMSSLDAARAHAFTPGAWRAPLAVAQAARGRLRGVPGVLLLEQGTVQAPSGAQSCSQDSGSSRDGGDSGDRVGGFDPLRLVLNVSELGISGFEAAEWLENRHGVVPELATLKLVVLVVGPGSVMQDAEALVAGVRQLAEECREMGCQEPTLITKQPHQQPAQAQALPHQHGTQEQPPPHQRKAWEHQRAPLTPREAFFAPTERVTLSAAAGRVCAELLCPYPPGVPLLFPGERIGSAAIDALRRTLGSGGVVVGASDASLHTVLVAAEG